MTDPDIIFTRVLKELDDKISKKGEELGQLYLKRSKTLKQYDDYLERKK